MLALITENSWKLNAIDRNETIQALSGIVPESIVSGLFQLYTKETVLPNDTVSSAKKFEYREDMVCRVITQNILQQGLKFYITDFIATWQDALPEGLQINVREGTHYIYFCFYFYCQICRNNICEA